MPNFAYRALTATGERVTGELEAADVPTAIARLQDSGLIPIDAAPGRPRRPARAPRRSWRRAPARHVTQLSRELATLIGAGQTVEGALSLAREEVPDRGLAAALEGVLLEGAQRLQPQRRAGRRAALLPAALCQPGARRRGLGPARRLA